MVLKTEGMDKVRIIAMRDDVERVINELVDFGAIHVTRSKRGESGEPLKKYDEIAGELVWLRACEKTLGTGLAGAKAFSFNGLRPLDELVAEARAFKPKYEELNELISKLQGLRNKESSLASRARELEPFREVRVPPALLKSPALEFRYMPVKTGRGALLEAAKGLKADFLFVEGPRATEWVLAAFDKKQLERMAEVLAVHCGPSLNLPEVGERGFLEEWKVVEKELSSVRAEIAKVSGSLEGFKKKHFGEIVSLRKGLEIHARKAELPSRFGRTRSLEIVEGWVPARLSPDLEKRLGKKFADKILIEKVATDDQPPAKLLNPPLIRRFEFLVKFFSLPGRDEWDPTLFIAITFPIIFGMILGDIGYGIVSFALALLVRAKVKGNFFQSAAGMLILSSITTTIFGFIYGEIFGTDEFLGMKFHPFVERGGEGVAFLVALSLLVGIIHVGMGLMIGVVWNALQGHYKHAAAKALWLVLEAALIIISAALVLPWLVAFIPSAFLVGAVMALAAIAGLYFTEGYGAVFEVPSLLANMLSYLRIMALGLSGVILAKIINQIPAGAALEGLVASASAGNVLGIAGSLVTFAIFGAVLVVGHAGALALGLFESSIQSLRLHYVEFFSKFYHGGGFAFVPLSDEIKGE